MIISNQLYVCRMKERVKRAGAQKNEEDSEKKSLQVISMQMNIAVRHNKSGVLVVLS